MVFSRSEPVRACQRVQEFARPTGVRSAIVRSLTLTSRPPRDKGDQLPSLPHSELRVLQRAAPAGISFGYSVGFEKWVVAPAMTMPAKSKKVAEVSDLPISLFPKHRPDVRDRE